MLFAFRAERIKQYKLVFPQLTTKHASESTSKKGESNSLENSNVTNTNNEASLVVKKSPARKSRVGESVAPVTMFQKMKGNTNPDLIAQVRILLICFQHILIIL